MSSQLAIGQRVWCVNGDDQTPGVIDQVNDPDQGDFEYHVQHDDGGRSFWPRESLVVEQPAETQFRMHVRGLLARGIKPTPKVLKNLSYGNGRELGGRRSQIRRQEFLLAGWEPDDNGLWRKPR